jgi:hypothetical protein
MNETHKATTSDRAWPSIFHAAPVPWAAVSPVALRTLGMWKSGPPRVCLYGMIGSA